MEGSGYLNGFENVPSVLYVSSLCCNLLKAIQFFYAKLPSLLSLTLFHPPISPTLFSQGSRYDACHLAGISSATSKQTSFAALMLPQWFSSKTDNLQNFV